MLWQQNLLASLLIITNDLVSIPSGATWLPKGVVLVVSVNNHSFYLTRLLRHLWEGA